MVKTGKNWLGYLQNVRDGKVVKDTPRVKEVKDRRVDERRS